MSELKETQLEEETEETENIDDIPIVEGGTPIDYSRYEGMRVQIAKVEKIEAINFYTGPIVGGKPSYNAESTEKCMKIEVTTKALLKLDDAGQPTQEKLTYFDSIKEEEVPITVTARFNLKKVEGENGVVNWVISKTPRANLWKAMRKLGVEKLSEMIGKLVTITTSPDKDPDSDKVWPRLVL